MSVHHAKVSGHSDGADSSLIQPSDWNAALVVDAGTITKAMQESMATASLVYRKTAGAGAPEINTLATLKTDLALVKADVGLGSVDNTSDAGKPVSTEQQTALDAKINHSLATAANDFLVASGVGAFIKKTLAEVLTILGKAAASGLASLDASSKLVQARARADDGIGYVVLANDTLAQAYATNSVTKLTVTAARTLTTTVPPAGCSAKTIILTSGTTSFVITFGAGFKPTGTLSTGTVSARVFIISWISDGVNLYERGRTIAMVA